MKERTFFILVVLSSLLIVPKIRSANDASRMATVQALVEHGTFQIDSTEFINTVDKVFIGGNFYSDKPPFPSLLASAIYFPLYQFGFHLGYEWNLAYFLITLLVIKSIWIASLLYFYKLLGLVNFTGSKILLTSFLAFGSLYFSWSSTFNNHILAGSFFLLGLYFWVEAKQLGFSRWRSDFLSGFYFLCAGISDLPVLVFFFAFLLLLIFQKPNWKAVLIFLFPALLTVVPYLVHNNMISGSIKPFQIQKQFFEYPYSMWIKNNALSGVDQNDPLFVLTNAFQLLLGSKGFLLYSPISLISIWTLLNYKDKFKNSGREIWISLVCCFLIFGYYSVYSTNLSGGSYSIRWFVPFLPILVFSCFPFFEDLTETKKRILKILLVLSIVISSVGIINPWSKKHYNENSFLANLYNVVHYYELPKK